MGVIPDFVAFRDRAADDLGVEIHAAADDVEGRLDVALAEHVEQARGVLRVRSVIEGHGDVVSRDHDSGEGNAGTFREICAEVHVGIARNRSLDWRCAVSGVRWNFDGGSRWIRGRAGFRPEGFGGGATGKRGGGEQKSTAGEGGKSRGLLGICLECGIQQIVAE